MERVESNRLTADLDWVRVLAVIEELGPYRIVRRLATGGMAEVYLARHRALEGVERQVVLKRIHPQFASDEEFVTMFLDEARLMAALSHPHIAQVFDLGRVGDSYHLVMEHVRGPTLQALHEAARARGARVMPLEVSLPIVLQIAEALAYLHEVHDEFGRPLQIVHRDLNPSNVIVSYTGAAKLIDFGIAKAAIRVYETRQGVVKGTYGYIAPEQLRGEKVDHRADLFSLGVLMYELTTGELPFGPGESPGLLDRILHAQYRKPTRANPEFPAALEPLIQKCLTPDIADRWPSMRSFVEVLSEHMASRRMVVSMTRLGDAVRTLVPDPEASQPLVVKRVKSEPRAERAIVGTAPLDDDFTGTATAHSIRTPPIHRRRDPSSPEPSPSNPPEDQTLTQSVHTRPAATAAQRPGLPTFERTLPSATAAEAAGVRWDEPELPGSGDDRAHRDDRLASDLPPEEGEQGALAESPAARWAPMAVGFVLGVIVLGAGYFFLAGGR